MGKLFIIIAEQYDGKFMHLFRNNGEFNGEFMHVNCDSLTPVFASVEQCEIAIDKYIISKCIDKKIIKSFHIFNAKMTKNAYYKVNHNRKSFSDPSFLPPYPSALIVNKNDIAKTITI